MLEAMRSLALVLVLLAAPVYAQEPQVLHDFAVSLKRDMPAAQARTALERLYPGHLRDATACKPTATKARVPGHMRKSVCFPGGEDGGLPKCEAEVEVPHPEIDRKLGNLVPSVIASARGSFTRAHADELALWVAPGWCSDGARQLPTRLAVLAGERVVLELDHTPRVTGDAHVGFDFLGLAAKDVDGDGQD